MSAIASFETEAEQCWKKISDLYILLLVFEDEVSGIANGKVLISVEAGTVNFKELLITGNTLKEPDVKNVLVEIWLPCI